MESPVDESGRPRHQRVDALIGKQDASPVVLVKLLDAGSDVNGVTDQGELDESLAVQQRAVKSALNH